MASRPRMPWGMVSSSARTIEGRSWRTAEDGAGRRIFTQGPRRKLWIEAACARALVKLFRHETGRALYEHVGDLLIATFPSLAQWAHGAKRPRDRVKDLLKDYPEPSPLR